MKRAHRETPVGTNNPARENSVGETARFGLQKTTLLDFPGVVAATVFTPGCNLRCPYCHNPSLVQPPFPDALLGLDALDAFFSRRRHVLGGVCITGGEPLLHPRIEDLIQRIRQRGLKVKLDTNGTFPDRLGKLVAQEAVDYVAMDVKTAPSLYGKVLPNDDPAKGIEMGQNVVASVGILRRSRMPYELRTTMAPGIVGLSEMPAIAELLPGARRYVIQPFRGGGTLDPAYARVPPPSEQTLKEACRIASAKNVECISLMN